MSSPWRRRTSEWAAERVEEGLGFPAPPPGRLCRTQTLLPTPALVLLPPEPHFPLLFRDAASWAAVSTRHVHPPASRPPPPRARGHEPPPPGAWTRSHRPARAAAWSPCLVLQPDRVVHSPPPAHSGVSQGAERKSELLHCPS